MSRMVRKQVYIEPRQDEMLKRRARELGVSEAELIRRAIEEASGAPHDREAERLAALEELKGFMLRRRAWHEAKSFIEQRMGIVAPQTGRGWTRDELYEERLARYSR
jgi:hypothetical protein